MLLHLLNACDFCATSGHLQLATTLVGGIEVIRSTQFESSVLIAIIIMFFHDHALVSVIVNVIHHNSPLNRLFKR